MLKKNFLAIVTTIVFCLSLATSLSFACSDFQIKAQDNSIIVGRSMEFALELDSKIVIVPRGEKFVSVSNNGVKGVSWTNKYGFLGINGFNIKGGYVDGFNEKGLALEALMFTGAKYQPAVPGKFVSIIDLGSWIMGNFASVEEVKKALPQINVTAASLKKPHGELGLHLAVHDATGKNLVIEFIDGKVKVYDNPLGVMTNRPDFDWQMNNLRNFINLDSHDKHGRMLNGVKIEPTGVGSGMLGFPGDWTPPSRFVRLAYSVDAALPVKNAATAVNLAEHLLNMVDIPKGMIKEKPTPFAMVEGYAQWVVIKDLTNRVLYYKTYENTTWKKIDLRKLNLAPGAPEKTLAIDDKQQRVVDVSGELK